MRTESRELTAEFLWERRKAGRLLCKLDVYEDFAVACDKTVCGREAYRAQYRKLLGIDPEQRRTLRTRLVRLQAGETVADVVRCVADESYSNGDASRFT